jgi:hypothetical protein
MSAEVIRGPRFCVAEAALVSPIEDQTANPDLFFWVQFGLLWERLAGISDVHRSEYLEKARTCLERAEIIRAKLERQRIRILLIRLNGTPA